MSRETWTPADIQSDDADEDAFIEDEEEESRAEVIINNWINGNHKDAMQEVYETGPSMLALCYLKMVELDFDQDEIADFMNRVVTYGDD